MKFNLVYWVVIVCVVIVIIILFCLQYDRLCQPWHEATQDVVVQFNREGFVIVRDVFTDDEIKSVRKEIEDYIGDSTSLSVVDFVNRGILPKTSSLRGSPRLHMVLRQIFDGDDYRFCNHNDIGYERIVPWHKDRLNDRYRKYERLDPFSTEQRIVKVAIYLQSHENDSHGLHVVPRSQTKRQIETRGCRVLRPKIGWVGIFDQRLTHRGDGLLQGLAKYLGLDKSDGKRILVSFGYGRNNEYTDQFEEGTRARQAAQLAAKSDGWVKIF